MADDGRTPRPRATPLLFVSAATQLCAIVLFLANVARQHTPAVLGWLPVVVATAAAAVACWRAAATAGPDPVVRRLWHTFGVVCALVTAGAAGDVRAALAVRDAPVPGRNDPLAAGLYILAMLVLLAALLRLPFGGERRRERIWRFALDAATVAITVGIFAWYFGHRRGSPPGAVDADAFPLITLVTLGLLGSLALIKVAMSGLRGLDRVTVRLLAGATAGGAAASGLFQLVVPLHHGIDGAQVFLPAAMLFVVFAADRQRRAAGGPHAGAPGRLGLVPYVAVGATECLLLAVAREAGARVLVVAAAAVSLTALVVIRQIHALRENGRLLRANDAQLRQLASYQDQLTHRATHDALTGLANRALFEQETRAALAAGGQSLSLALIDLDDFKVINDRLGHVVGDALLVVVAERLRDCVRRDDVVARLGGDEFGMLLRGLAAGEADDVVARITDALHRPIQALGHDLLVGASVGLAEGWPGAGPPELLRRADLAMYAAKERGKGGHAVYNLELERHQAADAQLGAELRRALDRGEFSLVYQPIVRLPDGAWTGLETLVRWQHPVRGAVGPDTFIPIAERTGLIVPLGDWILRTALRQAAEWTATFGPNAPREIGVNVSARQLREPGFAGDVRDALGESGFDPERLVVEVTETAVFDGGVAVETLMNIIGLGARVALDDFGTGHSSLGLLRSVPADILKVDKSFVRGIGHASEEAVIATAMIQITNGLHLQAIAEGVETAEQAATLHRLGYRYAQGYHFSRPLAAEQIHAHLDRAQVTLPV